MAGTAVPQLRWCVHFHRAPCISQLPIIPNLLPKSRLLGIVPKTNKRQVFLLEGNWIKWLQKARDVNASGGKKNPKLLTLTLGALAVWYSAPCLLALKLSLPVQLWTCCIQHPIKLAKQELLQSVLQKLFEFPGIWAKQVYETTCKENKK